MQIIIIVILVMLSAIFSSTETAFSSVSRIRLKHYAEQGNKSAKIALIVCEKFDKALTAILIGNNIVNIASTAIATVFFTQIFGASSVGVATFVMTIAVLIFGEVVPKGLASEHAEWFALVMARPLYILMIILKPLVFLLNSLKNIVSNLLKSKGNKPSVTEEELKYIIDEIEDEGVLEESESDLVRSALEFDETQVNEILIPRVNVEAIDIDDDIEDIKKLLLETRFSRFPVYEESIDNVIGILHQSDFYEMYLTDAKSNNLRDILKKPLFVTEHQMISETLKEIQRAKVHLAIVADEYGGTKGIVTLEDILEELVGEIYDESDDLDTSFIPLGNNKYEVSADLSINDFLDKVDLPENSIESDCTSIGGWFVDNLERIAKLGDKITIGRFFLKAIMVDDQRLERVFINILSEKEEKS